MLGGGMGGAIRNGGAGSTVVTSGGCGLPLPSNRSCLGADVVGRVATVAVAVASVFADAVALSADVAAVTVTVAVAVVSSSPHATNASAAGNTTSPMETFLRILIAHTSGGTSVSLTRRRSHPTRFPML
jgi:hypothetical protein